MNLNLNIKSPPLIWLVAFCFECRRGFGYYRLGPLSLNHRHGFPLSLWKTLFTNVQLIFRDGIAGSCPIQSVGEMGVEVGVFNFLERDY